MSTDYNTIAEQYKRSKLTPWRTYVEKYTLLELLGDLSGKSVLDLACGEGFYSRLFKANGASRVLGVDLSDRMIDLARASEAESPLGVEYVVGDALVFRAEEQFDIVAAAYLLNYANTEQKLFAMCETIGTALKADGRFVTVNNNPSHSPSRFQATRKYGFVKSVSNDLRPGTPITYTIFQDGESFSFDNYYLSPAAHERALERAGLQEIEWSHPRLSPTWQGEAGYWDAFFDDPSVIFLQCRKPK
jgi:toxoflavin synthase